VRQLASSLQTTVGGNQEFAYSIQYSSYLTFAKSQYISQSDESNWVNTHTATTSTGNLDIYTEIKQAAPSSGNTPVLIQNYEIIPPSAFGRGSGSSLGGNYVDGEL
jgi:hypothetical protein